MTTASQLIQSMYAAINRRDLDAAMTYIDERCVYQDLNFPQAFSGKEGVRSLFEDSINRVPNDFIFVIDDIAGDDQAVGITWHVELDGVPFPNTRGASFYRVSPDSGLLIFGRDVVESPVKLGKVAFTIIRAVTPLARRFLKSGSASDRGERT